MSAAFLERLFFFTITWVQICWSGCTLTWVQFLHAGPTSGKKPIQPHRPSHRLPFTCWRKVLCCHHVASPCRWCLLSNMFVLFCFPSLIVFALLIHFFGGRLFKNINSRMSGETKYYRWYFLCGYDQWENYIILLQAVGWDLRLLVSSLSETTHILDCIWRKCWQITREPEFEKEKSQNWRGNTSKLPQQ